MDNNYTVSGAKRFWNLTVAKTNSDNKPQKTRQCYREQHKPLRTEMRYKDCSARVKSREGTQTMIARHRATCRSGFEERAYTMKYEVSTCTESGKEIMILVSVRSDASRETLFKKCASEMHHKLNEMGLVPDTIRFGYELPNIWTNGAVGAVWFEDPYYNICIARENCGYIAC